MHRLLRRTLFTGSAALAGAVLWGAQSASADGGGTDHPDQVQEVVVDNSTAQDASAAVSSGQVNASAPVSVGGGGGGSVSQSNDADNSATAGNENITDQTVSQAQGSSAVAFGGDASGAAQDQSADVSNGTYQSADADVDNHQSNINAPTSVGGGGGGSVTQSNEAANEAEAGNSNDTIQDVLQGQGSNAIAIGGDASGASQDQSADVSNGTYQRADADVDNHQSNINAPTSVGGGRGGSVDQSNSADNAAAAGNENITDQYVTQGQGSSAVAIDGDASGAAQDQSSDVWNGTYQWADADVDNDQSNINAPTSVGGGGGGSVDQSNSADNAAAAGNENFTGQYVTQGQGSSAVAFGGGHASGAAQDQSSDVWNGTYQWADADVDNDQSNINAPTSVGHGDRDKGKVKSGDDGNGGGGSISQSNEATNAAAAGNSNDTVQEVTQAQAADAGSPGSSAAAAAGGHGHGRDNKGASQDQSADVSNWTDQWADADVDNDQSNISAGVSVGGAGGGSVSQSNEATNVAAAGNLNETIQVVDQGQAGTAGSSQAQSADVANATDQSANATVTNGQYNIYAPVSVNSPGANSGSVTQSNSADNIALAGNANVTFQSVEQAQAGGSGGGGAQQYAALSNHTSQSAHAGVYNGQYNIYAPVYVNSPGAGSGNVSQSNSATNIAAAGNANGTDQAATQGQARARAAARSQAALVANGTSQSAHAGVYNGQYNIYAPVYVNSRGAGSGNVSQSNSATNIAVAANLNDTSQDVDQAQASGGRGGGQRQIGLVLNRTRQSANGSVFNGQANIHAPVTVGGGGGGSVTQSNSASNSSFAFNVNGLFQRLVQAMAFRF